MYVLCFCFCYPARPDDRFVTDQHPRGFARLIDGMTRASVPPGDPRVVFGARVTRVAYGGAHGHGCEVAAADGRGWRARHEVFSTLPLGVLQRDHVALKRQHQKLKQRLRERERGAGDGAAAPVVGTGSERAGRLERVSLSGHLSSESFRDAVSARVGM